MELNLHSGSDSFRYVNSSLVDQPGPIFEKAGLWTAPDPHQTTDQPEMMNGLQTVNTRRPPVDGVLHMPRDNSLFLSRDQLGDARLSGMNLTNHTAPPVISTVPAPSSRITWVGRPAATIIEERPLRFMKGVDSPF